MSQILETQLSIIKTLVQNLRPRDLVGWCYQVKRNTALANAVDMVIQILSTDNSRFHVNVENTINCYIQVDPLDPMIGEFYFDYNLMAFLPEGGMDRYVGYWKYRDWNEFNMLLPNVDIFNLQLYGYTPNELMDRVYSASLFNRSKRDVIIEDLGDGKIRFWKDYREFNFYMWVQDHPEHPDYSKYDYLDFTTANK